MIILKTKGEYPCGFELKLFEWERYDSKDIDASKTVPQGDLYTLWIEYRMILKIADQVLYQSATKATLVLRT